MSLASTTKVTVRCPHTGRTDRRGPVAALNVASEPRRTRKTRVQSAATSPIVQSAAAVLAKRDEVEEKLRLQIASAHARELAPRSRALVPCDRQRGVCVG